MRACNHLGVTAIIGEDQGFEPLPIVVERLPEGNVVITTTWEPSVKELALLKQGHKIQLQVLTSQHPPVIMKISEKPIIAIPIPNKDQTKQ